MQINIDTRLLVPKRSRCEHNWNIWQKKNLNIHRGVIEWHVDQDFESLNELAAYIRRGVKNEFRPNRYRGFGFGAILHLRTIPNNILQICEYIDRRNKKEGVWQWAVLLLHEEKIALGVHTWLHGHLRPVYDNIIQQLDEQGYTYTDSDAEIDPLILKLEELQRKLGPISGIGIL